MKNKDLKDRIKATKAFLCDDIDNICYFRQDGVIHSQVYYNIFACLRDLALIVEDIEKRL